MLRVEIQIKGRKIKNDYEKKYKTRKGYPFINEDFINKEYLEDIYKIELERLLKEGEYKMKKVSKSHEVEKRLRVNYGERLGSILYSTWTKIVLLGYKYTRDSMKRETFYRHKKKLVDVGISLTSSDIEITKEGKGYIEVPHDFIPFQEDIRQVKQINAEDMERYIYFITEMAS